MTYRNEDEFAMGIEGVHGWELTIAKYKIYLLVCSPHI